MMAGMPPSDPSTPRSAATVVVVDASRPPARVLLIRRPEATAFAAGMLVFPGGSVDPVDRSAPDPVRAAALREVFEEVGLLYASRPTGGPAAGSERERVAAELAGGRSFHEALELAALTPGYRRLAQIARIVTPPGRPRRYDTHFFIAHAPRGQDVRPAFGEVTDFLWVEAGLAAADRSLPLMPPTRAVLQWIGAEADMSGFVRRWRRRRRALEPMVRTGEADGVATWSVPWPPR